MIKIAAPGWLRQHGQVLVLVHVGGGGVLAGSDAGSLPPGVPPFEGTPRAVPLWRDGPAAGGVSAAARLLVLGVLVEGGESYTHGRSHVYAHDDTHFHVYLSACVIFMCPYICQYTCMRTIHMPAYMSTHMPVRTSMPVSIHIHTDTDKNRHIRISIPVMRMCRMST